MAGNAWNFVLDSNCTTPFCIDNSIMAVRNADTTDNNNIAQCFQSNSITTGGRFHGVCFLTEFLEHTGSDTPVQFSIWGQTWDNNGAALKKLADFRWDKEQGGVSMSLGMEPIRQGFGMPPYAPLYWALDGQRLVAWKPARDGVGNWRFNTLQIGDNNNLGGASYIAAPSVGTDLDNIAGTALMLEGGNSRGTGNGGRLCLSVAAGGTPGVHTAECVVEVVGLSTPVVRPAENGVTPLGDAQHGWGSIYIGQGGEVYLQGDAKGLYAQLQDALARIRVLEARAFTQSTIAP